MADDDQKPKSDLPVDPMAPAAPPEPPPPEPLPERLSLPPMPEEAKPREAPPAQEVAVDAPSLLSAHQELEASLSALPKPELVADPPVRPSPPQPILPQVLASAPQPKAPAQPVSLDPTPKQRVAARGQQRAKERKQRLGILPPDLPIPTVTDGTVDITGPPPGRHGAAISTLTGPPPMSGQQPQAAIPQAAPNAPQQGDTAGVLKSILDELKRQSNLLAKIAERAADPVVS